MGIICWLPITQAETSFSFKNFKTMLNIQKNLAELEVNKLTAVPMDAVAEFVALCHQKGICPQGGAFDFESNSQYFYTD